MATTDFSKIKQAKFIRLGREGKWTGLSLKDGTLRLGYYEVPSSYKADHGKQPIFDIYRPRSKNDQAATNHARQVQDFYAAGPETLWITFSGGKMWWCQAEQAVEFISNDKAAFPEGSRLKRTISPWSDRSRNGKVLNIHDLSGRLTKAAAFRGTICAIQGYEFDYLMRILKGEEHPEIVQIRKHKKKLEESIVQAIKRLTWHDFELLVDLIFSNSGWRRVSQVGGTQKTIDIEIELPVTNERAVVQVKSSTNRKQLQDYLQRFKDVPASKYFYVYHSCKTSLESEEKDVVLMGPEALSEHVLRAGLTDWLIEKAG